MKEDLLMDNNNKNSLKKPLIYGAIAFLIFVIIVIVIALVQNSKSSNNQIVPVENKPQEVLPQNQHVNNQTQQMDFQPLQVEEETPNINKNQLLENNNTKNTSMQKAEKPETKSPLKESENKQSQTTSAKSNLVKKAAPIEKNKTKYTKKTVNGNYYIQVAALLKYAKPNKKFLALIKKNGFDYRFYVTYINKNGEKIKVTKVLIGPFKSRTEAKKSLNIVKQKITQNAFVFKVK
ncbi:SPOR domain-containing protein [Caminibacter sp.]